MHKFVYWVGVYSICVTMHYMWKGAMDEWQKVSESKEREKKPMGFQPEKARKPMNKIGFAINSD